MYKIMRTHVHSRVLIQLVIFVLVSLGLLVAVGYDAIAGQIGLGLVAVALIGGIIVGYIVGKIFKLSWHTDTRKVIMSLDRTSFVLIGLYVVFRIFGSQLLGKYIQGATLEAFTFAFLGGILIGRLISVWNSTSRILKEQGVL